MVENTSNFPQGFEIFAVAVDGQPLSTLSLNVILDDISPDQSREIVWRIRTNDPGRLIEFTSDYRVDNYYNVPLAPRLREINTTFATPENPFLYGCLTGAFDITGTVKDELGNPVTDVVFLLGYGPDDTDIVATTIITPLMDATGAYTIPNLTAGHYTFTPLKLEDLNSPLAFTESLPYTVIPASLGQAQEPGGENNDVCVQMIQQLQSFGLLLNVDADELCSRPIPSSDDATIEDDDSPDHPFILLSPPEFPDPGIDFKGAGWLRWIIGPNGQPQAGVEYEENEIGWNLEAAGNMDLDYARDIDPEHRRGRAEVTGLGGQILEHWNEQHVSTIIRLESPPPNGNEHRDPDTGELDMSCEGDYIQAWMDDLDQEYTEITQHPSINVNSSPVRIFIFGNEPNHFRDEWNYSGSEYAHVYNCYFQERWQPRDLEENDGERMNALYVAGPGQQGPCERNQETDELSCLSWENFYQEMLITGSETITYADGFALHAYGYYQLPNCIPDPDGAEFCGDFNGQANWGFQDWLIEAITDIRSRDDETGLASRPIILTEYNPGLYDNNQPHDPPDGWQNWFNRTHCWIRQHLGDQVHGILYFVDEPNSGFNDPNDEQWLPVSLRGDNDRRNFWLQVGTANQQGVNYDPDNGCQPPDGGHIDGSPSELYASIGDVFILPQPNTPSQIYNYQPRRLNFMGVLHATYVLF